MPFTPSHAVVALPFLRTPLIPAAIAVGAMTPDLPMYVRGLPLTYSRTHDLAWLPVTVLVAALLLVVWRGLLRPVASELTPAWVARRLPVGWEAGARDSVRETFGMARGVAPTPGRSVGLLAISLTLGVVSHIVWDLFTHEGRWGPRPGRRLRTTGGRYGASRGCGMRRVRSGCWSSVSGRSSGSRANGSSAVSTRASCPHGAAFSGGRRFPRCSLPPR